MRVVIVLPCYNERQNIIPLMAALQREFGALSHDMHILVVDDNSPDGTAELVRAFMRDNGNVHLISGTKRGLGDAYIRGMSHALSELDADAIFEMDADFSHDPADVPRLLQALENGADFVIGSRYVPGGTIPETWGWFRRLNSRFGNLVARYVAGLYHVRDCTAGFRAIRASILRSVDLSALRVRSYAFQVALLHEAILAGAVVNEIPVHFVDRKYGSSKLGLGDIAEFVVNAWWIRLRTSERFIKFAAVGLTGVAVNLGTFSLGLQLGIGKFVASPVAIELSIISNFLLNNYWTFRKRNTHDRIRMRGLKFNLVSLLSLVVSYGAFVVTSLLLPHKAPQIHQAIGIMPAMLVNYFLNSYWTFREAPAKETARSATRAYSPLMPNEVSAQ